MPDPRIPDLSTVRSPPPDLDLDYSIATKGKVIGSGGQAIVKRVAIPDPDLPAAVAIKEPQAISNTLKKDTVESFFEEARTWQTLAKRERDRDTEYIVGIVAIGEQLPWIAMEYMDGGTLADRLGSHPDGLPVDKALWIAECLCKGLKVAHDNGVAHLDLKPANVLFRETPDDYWDVPKIADWGLARTLLNKSGSMDALSIEYAAPEQFDSDQFGNPDTYTDIYQLGAVIYEMLTGRPPYTGGHTSIVHDVVRGDNPEPPSERREAVPVAVDEVVCQALSTEKSRRFHGEIKRLEQRIRDVRRDNLETHSGDARSAAERSAASGVRQHGNWPMFRANPARSGSNHKTRSTSLHKSGKITQQWSFETGEYVTSPAVADGIVYIGNKHGDLYALDAKTGTQQWIFQTGNVGLAVPGGTGSSPAVVDGSVYINGDKKVYAIDAKSGIEQWNVREGFTASPAVVDDTVYAVSRDSIYALDARTGAEKWSSRLSGLVNSSPAVGNGTVYVGDEKGHVYALDAQTGAEQWRKKTGEKIKSPAIADGTVYVAEETRFLTHDNKLYALNAQTGDQRWTVPSNHLSAPVVANGFVYFGGRGTTYKTFEELSDDGSEQESVKKTTLCALNKRTGSRQWELKAEGSVYSSPAVVDGIIYAGCGNYVYALDAVTGDHQWSFKTNASVLSSPAVVNGAVYVGDADGRVYALK